MDFDPIMFSGATDDTSYGAYPQLQGQQAMSSFPNSLMSGGMGGGFINNGASISNMVSMSVLEPVPISQMQGHIHVVDRIQMLSGDLTMNCEDYISALSCLVSDSAAAVASTKQVEDEADILLYEPEPLSWSNNSQQTATGTKFSTSATAGVVVSPMSFPPKMPSSFAATPAGLSAGSISGNQLFSSYSGGNNQFHSTDQSSSAFRTTGMIMSSGQRSTGMEDDFAW